MTSLTFEMADLEYIGLYLGSSPAGSLLEIDLSDNYLLDKGVEAIFRHSSTSQLQTVYLRSCGLRDSSLLKLFFFHFAKLPVSSINVLTVVELLSCKRYVVNIIHILGGLFIGHELQCD